MQALDAGPEFGPPEPPPDADETPPTPGPRRPLSWGLAVYPYQCHSGLPWHHEYQRCMGSGTQGHDSFRRGRELHDVTKLLVCTYTWIVVGPCQNLLLPVSRSHHPIGRLLLCQVGMYQDDLESQPETRRFASH